MKVSSIFNIPLQSSSTRIAVRPAGAQAIAVEEVSPAADAATESIGAFITPQSLVSFTGATGAISLLWSVLKTLELIPDGWSNYVGLMVSFIVGMLIYIINISGTNTVVSTRDKIIGFVIAVFNIFVLFNATRSLVGA